MPRADLEVFFLSQMGHKLPLYFNISILGTLIYRIYKIPKRAMLKLPYIRIRSS